MKRIAVLGASGFVGSSFVEYMLGQNSAEIVPFIHRSGSAWRLARHGLNLPTLDILVREEVDRALAGFTAVVNCTRDGPAVMHKGFNNLLATCKRRNIRLVHLSSVMVYGDPPHPKSESEDAPTLPAKGTYGAMKLRQDVMLQQACKDGLSGIILCPPNITGPYSMYLAGIVQLLRDGRFALLEDGSAPLNIVDVNNLAHAIECALESDIADGRRYFVTDGDAATWASVVEDLGALAGPDVAIPRISRPDLEALSRQEQQAPSSIWKSLKHLVSSDVRSALRKDPHIAAVDRVFREGIALLGPRTEDRLRVGIEGHVKVPSVRPGPDLEPRLCGQQLRGVRHSCERAKKELCWKPLYDSRQSMSGFKRWYRAAFGMDQNEWELLEHLL